MKNSVTIFFSFAFACLAICSCKQNKISHGNEESQYDSSDPYINLYNKSQTEYDSELQGIYYKEYTKYDIRGEIVTPSNTNREEGFDLGCELYFFNYGDDIRLFSGCKDDAFVSGIGTINTAYVLQSKDDIFNVRKEDNSKYGEWATVDISFSDYSIANDVFMTPLAMKAYNEGEKNSLIFIQLVAGSHYLSALFYGAPKLQIAISKFPAFIIHESVFRYDIDAPKNGSGQFWHDIDLENN